MVEVLWHFGQSALEIAVEDVSPAAKTSAGTPLEIAKQERIMMFTLDQSLWAIDYGFSNPLLNS